jgi:hypothetical protein
MIRLFLICYMLFMLQACNSSAFREYQVVSVDSIPGLKMYLITVKDDDKLLKIVSYYPKTSSSENAEPIIQGIRMKLDLKEIPKKDSPFAPLLENNRKGDNAVYVDGKLFYDPKENLYSSQCIQGLNILSDCK